MTYPAANLPALISVELLEGHLGLDPGTLPEIQAQAAIHGASGAVRDKCHWRLDYEEVTSFMPSGDGSNLLLLPTKHLIEVTRVVVDGEEWLPWSLTEDWQYSLQTKAGAVKARGTRRWPEEEGRIEIDFAHGWELMFEESPGGEETFGRSGLPAGLESIILAVAQRSLDNPEGYSALKVGQVSESYAGTGTPTNFVVSSAEEDQLAPYRIEID